MKSIYIYIVQLFKFIGYALKSKFLFYNICLFVCLAVLETSTPRFYGHPYPRLKKSYCEIWKLAVNVNKTKVMMFSKGKTRQNKTLEIVYSYSCFGSIFKYNGNFNETRKKLAHQAQKSLFSIYKK